MNDSGRTGGHVFISYVREDSAHVDRVQQLLQRADILVWRDTADLWPGQDWRAEIRRAITGNALVFLACFSRSSASRGTSYWNEELTLAIEQMRLRPPDNPWIIPVRFDECEIPERNIGGGRTLASIQRADLFGASYGQNAARLVQGIVRLLSNAAAPLDKPLHPRLPDVDVTIAEPEASDAGFLPPVRSVVYITATEPIADVTANYVTGQDHGGTTDLGHSPVHVSSKVWRVRSRHRLRSVHEVIVGYTTITAECAVQWFQWDGREQEYDRTQVGADGSALSALLQIKQAMHGSHADASPAATPSADPDDAVPAREQQQKHSERAPGIGSDRRPRRMSNDELEYLTAEATRIADLLPKDLRSNLSAYSQYLWSHDMLPPHDHFTERSRSLINWTKQAKSEWVDLLIEHSVLDASSINAKFTKFTDVGIMLLHKL